MSKERVEECKLRIPALLGHAYLVSVSTDQFSERNAIQLTWIVLETMPVRFDLHLASPNFRIDALDEAS